MAILRDWECAAHGHYESSEEAPKCPWGCSKRFQQVVFLKPVGTKSVKTKFQDRETRAMADSYGLTNIHTQRGGNESVMDAKRRVQPPPGQAIWLDNVQHAPPGFSWNKPMNEAMQSAPKFNIGNVPPGMSDSSPLKNVLPGPRAETVFVGRPKDGA